MNHPLHATLRALALSLLLACVGCYVLDGNRYLETITYHPLPLLVGETIVFDFLIEEGAWHHRARFEKGGEAFHIDEIWVRRDDPWLQGVE